MTQAVATVKYLPPGWAYRFAEACLDVTVGPTNKARCEAAKVTEQAYYRHRKRYPEFEVWLLNRLNPGVGLKSYDVQHALFKKCLTGDLAAIRLWFELFGNFSPGPSTVNFNTIEFSIDELKRLERILTREGEGAPPKRFLIEPDSVGGSP